MDFIKLAFKIILAVFLIFAGTMHFVSPRPFERIIPSYLPSPLLLVYISGVFEIAGGVGLFIPQFSRAAAWGIIVLLIAVFPANINMALHNIPFGSGPTPTWLLWARLPLQFVLILWAGWFTR